MRIISELANVKTALNNSKDVLKSIDTLKNENEELKKQLQQFEDKTVADLKKQIITSVENIGAVKFFASTKVELNSVEALRKLGIQLTTDLKDNFVLLLASSINGKNVVHLRISPSLNINGRSNFSNFFSHCSYFTNS